VGNKAGLVTQVEELLRGAWNDITAVNRVMIYVHSDELVSHSGVKIASELHGIIQRLVAMI
jgi:hypothetical protein